MSTPHRIVILTGAGISAESGLPTFRDANGLWENHRVEEIASPEAFAMNPVLVHRFYNLRRAALKTVQPNAAHEAIAGLQRAWPDQVTLVTQNVDDLHERGGSPDAMHMHGEILKIRCEACDDVRVWHEDLDSSMACESCGRIGKLRPHIVWFGEMPFLMEEIARKLQACTLFVAIGTSGRVYPAAGFVRTAKIKGARCVEFNVEGTDVSGVFDERRLGPATVEVPRWVEQMLGA